MVQEPPRSAVVLASNSWPLATQSTPRYGAVIRKPALALPATLVARSVKVRLTRSTAAVPDAAAPRG
jgi:hypothetical protein